MRFQLLVFIIACGVFHLSPVHASGTTVWQGTTADWNDPTNWNNGLPDASTTASIPSTIDVPFSPVLNTGSICDVYFTGNNIITIASGGSLQFARNGLAADSGVAATVHITGGTVAVPTGAYAAIGPGSPNTIRYNIDSGGRFTFADLSGGTYNSAMLFVTLENAAISVGNTIVECSGFSSLNLSDTITLTPGASDSAESAIFIESAGSNSIAGSIISEGDNTIVALLALEDTAELTVSGHNGCQQAFGAEGGAVRASSVENLGAPSCTVSFTDSSFIFNGSGICPNPFEFKDLNILTVPGSHTFEIAGSIENTSTILQKMGTGTLILSGEFAPTPGGALTVAEGTLVLNGPIHGNVTVNTGTTLKGTGTISGSVVVQGDCQPGTSIGTLTVTGNYSQDSGSALDIEVSPSNSSKLLVSGSVLIDSEATLKLIADPGPYKPQTTYTIVEATEGITGQFSDILLTGASNLIPKVFYQGTELILQLTSQFNLSALACCCNALQVATALDALSSTHDEIFEIAQDLDALDACQLNASLNAMQPSLYKAMTLVQQSNAIQVRETLTYRLYNTLDTTYCPSRCHTSRQNAVQIWVDGFGSALSQGETEVRGCPQQSYGDHTYGVVGAIEGHFARVCYLGMLGGYTDAQVKWWCDANEGRVQAGYGGLYFSALGDLFYLNTAVLASWDQFKAQRYIPIGAHSRTAYQHHSGQQLIAHADTGLNYSWQAGWIIRPFESLDYIISREDCFTECGAGALDLNVSSNDASYVRNELGLYGTRCLCTSGAQWIISPKLSWVYESRPHGETDCSSFVCTEQSMCTTGFFPSRSLVSPGLSIAGTFGESRWVVEVYYSGEFGHQFNVNNFGAQVRYTF